MLRERVDDRSIRTAGDHRVEYVFRRSRDTLEQMGSKDVELTDFLIPQRDLMVMRTSLQRGVDLMGENPARADIVAKQLVRQITLPSEELLGPLRGLLEMERFESVQRIVMDKRAHGPVRGDDLAREQDQRPE